MTLKYNFNFTGTSPNLSGKIEKSTYNYNCRVYNDSYTNTVDATWDIVIFDAEKFDPAGMHDNVANPSRITILQAGKYLIGGGIGVAGNAVVGCRIIKNRETDNIILASQVQGNGGVGERVHVVTLAELALNDYIELDGYAGSANDLVKEDGATYFWAILMEI